jgi:hypothetical protein
VVCTATSGVIWLVIAGSGAGARFEVTVDGGTPFSMGSPGPGYMAQLLAATVGSHVVAVSPPANCSVEDNPQSVTVGGGTLRRDTVRVTFVPKCQTGLRITAPTTGAIPRSKYSVWVCWDFQDGCDWGPSERLGALAPNDTLVAELRPAGYEVYLQDLPDNCRVNGPNPKREIHILAGAFMNLEFLVACA